MDNPGVLAVRENLMAGGSCTKSWMSRPLYINKTFTRRAVTMEVIKAPIERAPVQWILGGYWKRSTILRDCLKDKMDGTEKFCQITHCIAFQIADKCAAN